MKKRILIIAGILLSLILSAVLVFGMQVDDSNPDGRNQPAAQTSSDSNPSGPPEIVIPDALRAKSAVPGDAAQVYFTPMDESESTTVIFFYNTGDITQTVGIETFELNGSSFISTSLQVPARSLVRMAADPTDGEGSATWDDVAFVNFTTFSTYGRLSLPEGVKASGYIAWNDGQTYFPREPVPVLDLRFSIDPPTIFFPLTGADD